MKPIDIGLAMLIAAVWGFNFIAIKYSVEAYPPFMTNGLRFGLVLIMLAPFLKYIKGAMVTLIATALVMGVMHFGLNVVAMGYADGVGAVSIASELGVPFSTILAVVFLKESVGWRRVVGISLSFAGVLVLALDPVIFAYWEALAIMTASSLFYAITAILMRKLKDVPAVTTQAWIALAGVCGSFVLSGFMESGQWDALVQSSNEARYGILYSAIGSSIIGHGGANYLFRKYDVSVVSPYFLVMPLFTVLAGYVLLDEAISSKVVLGGALTLAGVLIVYRRNKARNSEVAEISTTEV